jgi:DNA topoisomerase-1
VLGINMGNDVNKPLVIVESPAKARTVQNLLGNRYLVMASMGHVRDLPQDRLGVEIEQGFQPMYVVIPSKRRVVAALKKAAADTGKILLAADQDREGEAISWHIKTLLGGDDDRYGRMVFNEVTATAIRQAARSPERVDLNKVDAQQARRVLDRLVGYKISPLLWKVLPGVQSAGRVQSVALRRICEREEQVVSHEPKEFWKVTAKLRTASNEDFEATLETRQDKKLALATEQEARGVVDLLTRATFTVGEVQTNRRKHQPPPPYITSTLQQDGANRLRFTPEKTMKIAQQLYEGLDVDGTGPRGLITYMRTDSTRVSQHALRQVRAYIGASHSKDYLPAKPRYYKRRKGAQEAHEAIRPTDVRRTPEDLSGVLGKDQACLYELIWRRFVASQMVDTTYEFCSVRVGAGEFGLGALGVRLLFDGFTRVYKAKGPKEEALPHLVKGERLRLLDVAPYQHFTKPPPRFTEASLIRELEAKGIGRPSTYAAIVGTIIKRGYADIAARLLKPTELGKVVNRILVSQFPAIFDVGFTARMEEALDTVEEGGTNWKTVIREFYGPFSEAFTAASQRTGALREMTQEETEQKCEKCGRPMVIKFGRHGRFLACSGFPACRNSREIDEVEVPHQDCPKCGSPMVVRHGRFGRFLACSRYPKCRGAAPLLIGARCPVEGCDAMLAERRSRRGSTFYGCTRYPECTFATALKPVARRCPECGSPTLLLAKDGQKLRCARCRTRFDMAASEGGEEDWRLSAS